MSYAGPGQVDDTLACDVDLDDRCACSLHLPRHVELLAEGAENCRRDDEDDGDTESDHLHGSGEARDPEVYRATRPDAWIFR